MQARQKLRSFTDYFRFNQFLLEFCGILPIERQGFLVSLILLILCIASCSFLVIPGMYTITTYGEQIKITEKINILGELLEILVGGLKVIALLPYRSRLLMLKRQAIQMWEGVRSDDDHREVRPYLDRALLMTYGFAGNVFFALSSLIVAPFFMHYEYDVNNTIIASKSLPYSIGIVHENKMLFNVWWALQAILGLIGIVPIIGIDTAMSFFVLYACAHLRLLKARFLNIAQENYKYLDREQIANLEDRWKEKTIACINLHKKIISYCGEVEEIFRTIVLIQTVCSIIAICGFGFNLLTQEQGRVKYGLHLAGATVQLLLFCWPADNLQTESLEIGFVAFYLRWYDWTKRGRFLIEFIIRRSQKPLIVTAGKFVNMSLVTFSSILSSAFSFFSILRKTL